MTWYWQAIATFFATLALDYVWAYYQRAVNSKSAGPAAWYAALIIGLNALYLLSCNDDHWMILPAAAGAFVGTYLSVRRH